MDTMIFLQNKYTTLYFKIIATPTICDYTEIHHIIPKSLGGSNHKDNLIQLSAREHFICHLLLPKMVNTKTPEWYKMIKAIMMMKVTSSNQDRYMNSRLFESYRKHFSIAQSYSQSGNKNSQSGTVWVSDLNKRISYKVKEVDLDNIISKSIIKKRIIDFDKYFTKMNKPKLKDIKINKKQEFYNNYYKIYKVKGFDEFVKITNYKYTKQNLVQHFKKYVMEFIPQNGKKRI